MAQSIRVENWPWNLSLQFSIFQQSFEWHFMYIKIKLNNKINKLNQVPQNIGKY